LPATRRTLDIGEQKGDGAGGRLHNINATDTRPHAANDRLCVEDATP
jgi:hypothetical protein